MVPLLSWRSYGVAEREMADRLSQGWRAWTCDGFRPGRRAASRRGDGGRGRQRKIVWQALGAVHTYVAWVGEAIGRTDGVTPVYLGRR